MSPPLRLVMFDMDGTLVDSQDFIVAAMGRAFAEIGAPLPPREKVLSIVGLSLDRAIATLLPDLGVDECRDAVGLYRQAFLSLRAENGGEADAPLYPGARAALQALAARDEVLMGVATGKARRGLDHACAAHDLDRFFVTRQTADHHPSKPHPSMLEAALNETGAEAGDAVMVGDTTYDIEMGRAAGFRTIGVRWGYHRADALRDAGADVLIADFAELPDTLDRLWGTA